MQCWQPSAGCLLTLKQLGFSPRQIDQALTSYQRSCDQPSDLGFQKVLMAAADTSHEQHAQLRAVARIPLNWTPSKAIENELARLGFDSEVITHYRTMYVIRARESDEIVQNPDAAFLAYCLKRPRALAGPMPEDWIPEAATIKTAMVRTGLDWNHITDRLTQFLSLHQYSVASDWNAKFLSWVTSPDPKSSA